MNPQDLMIHFGLPLVFLGVMFGGEAFVIPAGWLAYQGYIPLPLVILASALGSFVANQAAFQVGYHQGATILQKRPGWQRQVDRLSGWVYRHGTGLAMGTRFLVGFRTLLAFSFGMARYSPRKFAVADYLGALLWAALMSVLGFAFGDGVETALNNMKGYEMLLLIAIAVICAALWLKRTARSHQFAK